MAMPHLESEQFIKGNYVSLPSHNPNLHAQAIYAHSKREFAEKLVHEIENGLINPNTFNFRGISLSGADLKGINLRVLGGNALSQINFAGADLSGQNFSHLKLRKAHMPGATLCGTTFEGANLEEANLQYAKVGNMSLHGANAGGMDMTGAKGPNIDLGSANLGGAFLTAADLSSGYMGSTSFEGVKGRGLKLTGMEIGGDVSFLNADLPGADISFNQFKEGSVFAGAKTTGAKTTDVTLERSLPDTMPEAMEDILQPVSAFNKFSPETPSPANWGYRRNMLPQPGMAA